MATQQEQDRKPEPGDLQHDIDHALRELDGHIDTLDELLTVDGMPDRELHIGKIRKAVKALRKER